MNILPLKLSNSEHNSETSVKHFTKLVSWPVRSTYLLLIFKIATLCGSKPSRHRWNYFSKGQGMCVVMVTDKNMASSGFKANYEVTFDEHKKCSFFRKWTNLLNVFQAVANDVNQNAMQKSSGSKKGSKRSQMEQETNQVLPSSTGQNFWVIGG